MPEMKDLMPIVLSLVLVGMLIGVGVIIQSKTYVAFANEETYNDTDFTLGALDTSADFTKSWVQSLTYIGNGSDFCSNSSSNLTLVLNEETSKVTVGAGASEICYGGTFDVEYKFRDVANSDASSATSSMLSATKDIATSWMSLIITVIVLSIILGLVIGSFGGTRR